MVLLARRQLIAGALAAAAQPAVALAAAPGQPASLHFAVYRNRKPFGRYQISFNNSGDVLTVVTDVAMNMSIMKMDVFDYSHHCEEVWRGGKFQELYSQSVRDKGRSENETVRAKRTAYGIQITTNKGPLSAPADANPLTHWNAAVLGGPLFNPQDGLMLDLIAHPVGRDGVLLANGQRLTGTHWALRGAQQLDEWYDDAGVWAGLSGVFPDRSVIEYRRL